MAHLIVNVITGEEELIPWTEDETAASEAHIIELEAQISVDPLEELKARLDALEAVKG